MRSVCGEACESCEARGGAIDRRDFISRSALAAAALLLASCAGDDATGPDSMVFSINLADHPELAQVGGIALVSAPNDFPVAVVRTADGYIALSRVCPHQGATVGLGSGGFLCPRHGARFATDGTWVGGQRTSSLRRLEATLDGTGTKLTIG